MAGRPSPAAVVVILAILCVPLAPFWLNAGKPAPEPPVLAAAMGEACIESAPVMRTDHMRLLAAWRDMAVRQGRRSYTASDGRVWLASMQGTCLACHTDKAGFCDACHSLHAVSPDCWSCHIAPEQSGTPGKDAPMRMTQ